MIGYPEYRVDAAPPTLQDYLRSGAIDDVGYQSLRGAVSRGQCIGIYGASYSGRTSLLRALIHEYQSISNEPRRAMVVSAVPGELKKQTPLLALTLANEDLQNREIAVPDFIEPVFADDLSTVAMRGAIPAWRRHGGAFTLRATSFSDLPEDLRSVVAVSVLMQDGKIAMLIDSLPHENTPEKIEERRRARETAEDPDALFDEIVTHYAAQGRLLRRGPHSGRSKDSMTRRASIRDNTEAIGTLQVSTVMLASTQFERRLTWTSHTISSGSAASVEHKLTAFDEAIRLIG